MNIPRPGVVGKGHRRLVAQDVMPRSTGLSIPLNSRVDVPALNGSRAIDNAKRHPGRFSIEPESPARVRAIGTSR